MTTTIKLSNTAILNQFKKYVAAYTWFKSPIRKSFTSSEIVGLNMAASSEIRKPFTIRRCQELIDSRELPLIITDGHREYFQVFIKQ